MKIPKLTEEEQKGLDMLLESTDVTNWWLALHVSRLSFHEFCEYVYFKLIEQDIEYKMYKREAPGTIRGWQVSAWKEVSKYYKYTFDSQKKWKNRRNKKIDYKETYTRRLGPLEIEEQVSYSYWTSNVYRRTFFKKAGSRRRYRSSVCNFLDRTPLVLYHWFHVNDLVEHRDELNKINNI